MTDDSPPPTSDASPPESCPAAAGTSENAGIYTSEELFAGRQEVCIRHDGELYRLRITRNGKLILHK